MHYDGSLVNAQLGHLGVLPVPKCSHSQHSQAQQRGYEIVHPLTTEEWGVTRFFVRAPDGNVLNVVQQH